MIGREIGIIDLRKPAIVGRRKLPVS